MQLNVVLLNSLIKAINHTYDILIIWDEIDMLLFSIWSFLFLGVLGFVFFYKRYIFFCIFSLYYILLFVFLFNLLINAIHYTYDILIIRILFVMLLLAIMSVSFWVVLWLDLLHKRIRFFCFLVLLYNTYTALSLTLY